MEPIDILYTPLDIDPIPNFDKNKLYSWIETVYPQNIIEEVPGSKNSRGDLKDKYPWNIVWPKYGTFGWMNDFDKEFPELAEYFCAAFGLVAKDIGVITMLPMKSDSTGLGFWHADNDETGLRLYLENDLPEENPLLLRPTKDPFLHRPPEISRFFSKNLNEKNSVLSEKIYTAKILSPTQGYYLNNMRAVHSPFITKPAKRISVFVQGTPYNHNYIKIKTRDLIVRSAKKYKDYAILWGQDV
jgi:hypothetical protein